MRTFARSTGVLLAAILTVAPVARADDAPAPEAAPSGDSGAPSAGDDFVKGELSSLGATALQLHDTRFGVELGAAKLGNMYYILLTPQFDLAVKGFGLGLGVPLRIPLYDPNRSLKNAFMPDGWSIRKEDYDEMSEFARVIRYVKYGKKEDNIFVNIGSEYAATLGHGAAMRRYLANVDVDRNKVPVELDAYGRYGGVELYLGDLLRPDRLFGALAFLKPLGFSENLIAQRLSLGVTWAADMRAPWELSRVAGGKLQLDTTHSPIVPAGSESSASVGGVTLETKVVKTQNADLKPWIDVSKLFSGRKDGGIGATLGMLGRFNLGSPGSMHALRAIVEARGFQGNYLPGYFDTFYEVQRYQYVKGKADASLPTKLFDVVNRPADMQYGYYLELQWAWIDRLAVTIAWEDATVKGGRNIALHFELPASDRLKFFGSLHRRSLENTSDLFTSEQFSADNTAYFAGLRFKLLPILFLNLRAWRAWQMDLSTSAFSANSGFEGNLEVGYEFSRD